MRLYIRTYTYFFFNTELFFIFIQKKIKKNMAEKSTADKGTMTNEDITPENFDSFVTSTTSMYIYYIPYFIFYIYIIYFRF